MAYGTTRRFRKQSGENPKRGQSDHLVGETIRKGVKAWDDKRTAKLKETGVVGAGLWEEGFSKGIDKIVDFGKKTMSGYYNYTKYPGKPHFTDDLK